MEQTACVFNAESYKACALPAESTPLRIACGDPAGETPASPVCVAVYSLVRPGDRTSIMPSCLLRRDSTSWAKNSTVVGSWW
ncbi:MAG: hypothetical protein ACI4UO_03215, partial [Paludibacteraceae bacterium]